MQIPLYQIDAFTDRAFGGNPAAVCPLDSWLPEATMQAIANENNLSETAFFVPETGGDGAADFGIRWFTPTVEVELAGHPTLATAWLILNRLEPGRERVRFRTAAGELLVVTRDGERLVMEFPSLPPRESGELEAVARALRGEPQEFLASMDGLAVFAAEEDVRALDPDLSLVAKLDYRGIIATAPGRDADFVSRFFAPGAGVPEDPVTGSAHCILTPYWARRLGKAELFARQISARGGELWCTDLGERVRIAGQAVPVLEGTMTL